MGVLTVVGSANKMADFEAQIESVIDPPFKATMIVPLGENDLGSNRFLALIEPENSDDESSTEEMANQFYNLLMSAEAFDNKEDALTWANGKYGTEAFSPFSLRLSAEEARQKDFLTALIHLGDFALIRGLLNKRPVAVIAHQAIGQVNEDNEIDDQLWTPLAILVDPVFADDLELAFRTSPLRKK